MNNKDKTKIVLTSIAVISILILSSASALEIGNEFPAGTMPDLNNSDYDLSNIIKKYPAVIWITDFCQVCVEGIDNFEAMNEEYSSKGVKFIIISLADRDSTKKTVEKHSITNPVLMGQDNDLTEILTGSKNPGYCPMDNLYMIDKNGIIKAKVHLPGIPQPDLDKLIDIVIKQGD